VELCSLHQDLESALNCGAVTHGSINVIAHAKSPQVLRLALQDKERVALRSRRKKTGQRRPLAFLPNKLTSVASIEAAFCFMASCSAYDTFWGFGQFERNGT
jgi:hypothetical protein